MFVIHPYSFPVPLSYVQCHIYCLPSITNTITSQLTDTCVKNGGSHFVNEIASREFIDNLISLINSYGVEPVNEDVKAKILELIQTWATAAEGRYNLVYISETYRTLQREGYRFPPRVDMASSMFDSNAPPEWADSDVCMRCRTPFTFTNRKHHCRNCGNVFCGSCSSKNVPLPHLGILQPVRVDDGCHARLVEKDKPRSMSFPKGLENPRPSRSLYQGSMQPRDARIDDGFDADLKKALEMSLEEAKGEVGDAGYTPRASQQPSQPPRTTSQTNGFSRATRAKDDDEDPELKAAIAASLQDMAGQVFAMFVLTVAAAEAAIGLAILVIYFRNRGSIQVEDVTLMKG